VPAADLSINANNDLVDSLTPASPAHAAFFLRGAGGTGPPIFDELRIDSTWAGVTPDGKLQYAWNDAGSGTWSDNTKWNDFAGAVAVAAPGGTGQVANFNNNIATGSTITVDGNKNIDTLNFSNKGSLTVTGGKLIVDTNASAGQIVAYKGSHTIASAIELGDNLAIKVQGSSNSGTAGAPDPAATLTLTGPVTGAGKTLSKYGQGTLTLGASNIIADDVKLAVRSGPLDLGANNETVASVTLGVGHTNPATAVNSTPDLATGSITGTGTLTSTAWDLQSGTISASMAGGGVVKNNQATVTLSGNNSYTGDTLVTGGVLVLAGTNSNSVRAVVQAPFSPANGTQSTLQISADNNMGAIPASPMADAINLGNGARLRMSENMVLNANRGITMTSASPGLIDISSGKTGEVAGVISGAGGLTKTGLGTLVVSGANTYAGATNVVSGGSSGSVLRIGTNNALPVGTTLGLNTLNATGAAVFDLGGFNQQVANVVNNSAGTSALPTITNSAVPIGTLTIANTAASTVAIPMSGNLALAKDAGGTLTITGANTYSGDTIVRAGVLSVANSGNLGASTNGIQLAGGTLRNTAAITSTRNVAVDAAGGTLDAAADHTVGNISGAGPLTKTAAGILTANHVRTSSLTISGGNVVIAPSGGAASGTNVINSLTIGDNKFDLKDNKLITTTAAGVSEAGIYNGLQGEVQRAYNFNSWDQPGLTTTMPDAIAGLTTIGVATGEQIRGLGPTDTDTFGGQTITGASTIAMYTYAGDANLDGVIDGGDYGTIDNFVQVPGASGYANGDFNYDGVIDGGDYGVIDNNIQAQGPGFPTSGATASASLSGVTAVPEPASLSLIGLGAASLLGRRRRRTN
jgi:autotransporter-associated beta strand protein